MTSKKKVLAVLQVIRDEHRIAPQDGLVFIEQERLLKTGLDEKEVNSIINQLRDDYECVEVQGRPVMKVSWLTRVVSFASNLFEGRFFFQDSYKLRVLANFDGVYSEVAASKTNMQVNSSKVSLPRVIKDVKEFAVHNDGSISFNRKPIPLEPKQQIVAKILLENYPNVVTFNELIEAYWDDDTEHESRYLDTKERTELIKNVHDCASKLRKIFSSLDQKNHIRNVPKTGYKFLA